MDEGKEFKMNGKLWLIVCVLALLLVACSGVPETVGTGNPHYGTLDCPDKASVYVREAADPKLYPVEYFQPLPKNVYGDCFTFEARGMTLIVSNIGEFEYKERTVLKDQVIWSGGKLNIGNSLFEVCISLDFKDYSSGAAQCYTLKYTENSFWLYDPPQLQELIEEAVAPGPTLQEESKPEDNPHDPEYYPCNLGLNVPIGIVFAKDEWDRNWQRADRWEADCIYVKVEGEDLVIFRKDTEREIVRLINQTENNTVEVIRDWKPVNFEDFQNLGSDLIRVLSPGGSWGEVRIIEVFVYEGGDTSKMFSGTGFPFKHDGENWLLPAPTED